MKAKLAALLAFTAIVVPTDNTRAAGDERLKETLRTLTLRLRSSETERNNLLSEKGQFEQEKKVLTAKVDALTKQTAADKEQINTLTSKAGDQEKELLETKEALAKWKVSHEQLTAAAQKLESDRSRLSGESIALKQRVDDRERKNAELSRLGNEILTRYEKFGLGDALAAREPFTGIARVKLETLVQDYQDKITDQKVKPEKASGPVQTTPTPSASTSRK